MAATVKALLYLGAILLLGAGILPRFIGPALGGAALRSRLRWGAAAGAALIIAGSVVDLAVTLHSVLGFLDAGLLWDYTLNTRHGRATLARLGLTLAAAALRRRGPNLAYALAGALLLGTFSWTSHAAAMGGTPPLLADLIHFAAAAAWAGPILYLALTPGWHERLPALRQAFRRLSRTGLASVLVLTASGAYTALIHLQDPERFVASPYGLSLGLKLVAFAAIVGVAALNRFRLLPAFLATDRPEGLRSAVRIEALLLVAVFALTGALTTSSLPHDPTAQPTALQNLAGFVRYLLGN